MLHSILTLATNHTTTAGRPSNNKLTVATPMDLPKTDGAGLRAVMKPINLDRTRTWGSPTLAGAAQGVTWRGEAVSSPTSRSPPGAALPSAASLLSSAQRRQGPSPGREGGLDQFANKVPSPSRGMGADQFANLQAAAELVALFADTTPPPENAAAPVTSAKTQQLGGGTAPPLEPEPQQRTFVTSSPHSRRTSEVDNMQQRQQRPLVGAIATSPMPSSSPALSSPSPSPVASIRSAPRALPKGLASSSQVQPQRARTTTLANGNNAHWDYFAAEDETPRQICDILGGVDVCELIALNKCRYKGLHANARLMHGTQLLVPGGGPVPSKIRMQSAMRAPNAHASGGNGNPKPRLVLRKPDQQATSNGSQHRRSPPLQASSRPKVAPKQKSSVAPAIVAAPRGPAVTTAVGPIRLGDLIYVKWIDGDGQFYAATVSNVSPSRGITVKYPESKDWASWTEVLPISDIVPERVSFKRKARIPNHLAQAGIAAARRQQQESVMAMDLQLAAAAARTAPAIETEQMERPAKVASASWTDEEDLRLIAMIDEHGEGNWATRALELGTNRSAKACQTRYRNHLRHRKPAEKENLAAKVAAAASKAESAVVKSGAEGKGCAKRKQALDPPASPQQAAARKKFKTELLTAREELALSRPRSSRAAARKQVTYNVDQAFREMERESSSDEDSEDEGSVAAGRNRRGRQQRRGRVQTDDDESEEDEQTESESEDEQTESESEGEGDHVLNKTRRGGSDPSLISEEELERLRRQQLRWLKQQEARVAQEQQEVEEQEVAEIEAARQAARIEKQRKAVEAKRARDEEAAARREHARAERRRQQQANDLVLEGDEIKLAEAAASLSSAGEGSSEVVGAADDGEAKVQPAVDKKLQAKQRALMKLMKQLKVDAKPQLSRSASASSLPGALAASSGAGSADGSGTAAGSAFGEPAGRQKQPPQRFQPVEEGGSWSSSKCKRSSSPGGDNDGADSGVSSRVDGGDDDGSSSEEEIISYRPAKRAKKVAAPPFIPPPPQSKNWDVLLGRKLTKDFGQKLGVHKGVVTSYEEFADDEADDEPRIYTVLYADGDEEDLEEPDLIPLLDPLPDSGSGSSEAKVSTATVRQTGLPPVGMPVQYKLAFNVKKGSSGGGAKKQQQQQAVAAKASTVDETATAVPGTAATPEGKLGAATEQQQEEAIEDEEDGEAWMWVRGVVKRHLRKARDWVHVLFDDGQALDVLLKLDQEEVVWRR
eukprot:COSAG05_NODE_2_length_63105_cov_159.292956_24_plen_1233_part_00